MLTNVKNKLRYFLTYHIKCAAFKSIAEQGCQPPVSTEQVPLDPADFGDE